MIAQTSPMTLTEFAKSHYAAGMPKNMNCAIERFCDYLAGDATVADLTREQFDGFNDFLVARHHSPRTVYGYVERLWRLYALAAGDGPEAETAGVMPAVIRLRKPEPDEALDARVDLAIVVEAFNRSGLTQTQLAAQLGVSRMFVSLVLNGKRPVTHAIGEWALATLKGGAN
jgi:predicted XRE-type DNA-binding protein